MWDAWEGDKQYPLPAPPLVHPTPSPRCRAPRPPSTPLRANGACEQGGANGVRCLLVATPLPCACPLPLVRATSRGCPPPPFRAPPPPFPLSPPPLSTCAQNGGHTRPPCFRPPPTPQFPRACPSRLPPLSANGACELGARTGVVRKRRSQARPPPPLPRPRLAPPSP